MRFTVPSVGRLVLPPGKTDHIVFDDGLAGFGVRLRAGGKKVWIAQYRIGSKQRRFTIGSVDKLSLDAARSEAKAILAKVQLGADPQTEKAEARSQVVVTLGHVVEQYLEAYARKRLRPNSLREVERYLAVQWKPLRDRSAHDIRRIDVSSRLNEVVAENGPVAANRARACLSRVYAWAMREGIAENNPVAGSNRPANEVSRDRVLSDAEVRLVWRACPENDYGRIVRLLLLTGQRREEVGGMSTGEVDTAKALWSLPRERTKNGLPHDVPLSRPALDILTAALRGEERELLFGRRANSFSGWSKAKLALDARIASAMKKGAEAAGQKLKPMPPWRLHDLRRTAATRMADLGVLPHVVEAVINHVSGHRAGVAGIYNRAAYAAEKRAALDLWGRHVMQVCDADACS